MISRKDERNGDERKGDGQTEVLPRLRVIVNSFDDKYINATEVDGGQEVVVCYGADNLYLAEVGLSWDYLWRILYERAQLNLVNVRRIGDLLHPELIVFEPDYLISITTVASCFESFADSPYVNLIGKLSPNVNTAPIHLGNLVGKFLDEAVHDRGVSFEECMQEFINENAIEMIACDELTQRDGFLRFASEARKQWVNIQQIINHDLPEMVADYNAAEVRLEPSFICETLGIQGRMDFLWSSDKSHDTIIIEQKSGKGAYLPPSHPMYDPDVPCAQEKHLIQLMLYYAIMRYGGLQPTPRLKHLMLLYSKYKIGLVGVNSMPKTLHEAIRMRNLLAWTKMDYARNGFGILRRLTPSMLNAKHINGRLWNEYIAPSLTQLLAPIKNATELELRYYLRFLRFIATEQWLSKIGFAAVWLDKVEDKIAAGNIYMNLRITDVRQSGHAVSAVRLAFSSEMDVVQADFRVGDIVMLYPYTTGSEPNACSQMIVRATIEDIRPRDILLRLRNRQTDIAMFQTKMGCAWAIEHDTFDSASGGAYAAMHAFLSATEERRRLLLCQRLPREDGGVRLLGDYGRFNDLVLRAKQARELFLIIGPPGTGKTSHGLVNLLREELLEPGHNILLLSYTNRAVDEICSKLLELREQDKGIDFIRMGAELSCGEAYRPFLLKNRSNQLKSGNEVRKLIHNTRIFVATTSSINAHLSLLKIKHFHLMIVDEASQILEPQLAAVLSMRGGVDNTSGDACAIDRFVLIGDHKQLPAVVQQTQEESVVDDKLLQEIHLTDCRNSLFERLLMAYKTDDGYDDRFVYMLTRQGRMHPEIAAFPNKYFYGGRLEVVPLDHQVAPYAYADDRLCQQRLAFVNCPTPVGQVSDKTNAVEAEAIASLVHDIYRQEASHFNADATLGVIVPYRNQIAVLRNAISAYSVRALDRITIDTVERFQGSQRDYIIYGLTVREECQLNFLAGNTVMDGDTIVDRKLNVAMTRARQHLFIFGNERVVRHNAIYAMLIDYIRQNGYYLDYKMPEVK